MADLAQLAPTAAQIAVTAAQRALTISPFEVTDKIRSILEVIGPRIASDADGDIHLISLILKGAYEAKCTIEPGQNELKIALEKAIDYLHRIRKKRIFNIHRQEDLDIIEDPYEFLERNFKTLKPGSLVISHPNILGKFFPGIEEINIKFFDPSAEGEYSPVFTKLRTFISSMPRIKKITIANITLNAESFETLVALLCACKNITSLEFDGTTLEDSPQMQQNIQKLAETEINELPVRLDFGQRQKNLYQVKFIEILPASKVSSYTVGRLENATVNLLIGLLPTTRINTLTLTDLISAENMRILAETLPRTQVTTLKFTKDLVVRFLYSGILGLTSQQVDKLAIQQALEKKFPGVLILITEWPENPITQDRSQAEARIKNAARLMRGAAIHFCNSLHLEAPTVAERECLKINARLTGYAGTAVVARLKAAKDALDAAREKAYSVDSRLPTTTYDPRPARAASPE